MSLRDNIKAADDVIVEEVNCPEWRCSVWVKRMSGADRDAFEEAGLTGAGKRRKFSTVNFRARIAVACCVDAAGVKIFEPGDESWLGEKSSVVLDRIFDVARRLNGMTEQDVEDLQGN